MEPIGRLFSWLLQKLAFALLLGVLGVAGFGLRIFLQDKVDYDLRRQEIVRTLTGEVTKLQAMLAGVEPRMSATRTAIAAQQDRAAQAARVARELDGLGSGLNRLTTDSDQLKENRERLERMRQMEAGALKQADVLQQELKRLQWEQDGLEMALDRLQRQLKSAQETNSQVVHYALEAWETYRTLILFLVVLGLFGPLLGRVLAYAVFAPLITRWTPVLLGRVADELPEITSHETSMILPLSLGDTLWLRPEFLQAAEEGLVQKNKRVLDWQRPLSWFAAGLTGLVELRNRTPASVYRATVSVRENSGAVLTLISLPPETSLVLRPSYLAGAVGLNGRKLTIRRHWRLFNVQSWVRGQFGFLEFCGPCRLIAATTANVCAEVLASSQKNYSPVCRIGLDETIGFTPGLICRTTRTASFWAYLRNQGPLFIDRFVGQGLLLSLEGSTAARKSGAGLRRGLLRLFGL